MHICKEDFHCFVVLVYIPDIFPLCVCFACQFYIVKENRGNEGTCVGVSRWPVHDFNHRTTSDMWLYRAYSGNLYHNGEQTLTLSSFTQGDFITCVLDMEARTISFGKNGEVFNINQFLGGCFQNGNVVWISMRVITCGNFSTQKICNTDINFSCFIFLLVKVL